MISEYFYSKTNIKRKNFQNNWITFCTVHVRVVFEKRDSLHFDDVKFPVH